MAIEVNLRVNCGCGFRVPVDPDRVLSLVRSGSLDFTEAREYIIWANKNPIEAARRHVHKTGHKTEVHGIVTLASESQMQVELHSRAEKALAKAQRQAEVCDG